MTVFDENRLPLIKTEINIVRFYQNLICSSENELFLMRKGSAGIFPLIKT